MRPRPLNRSSRSTSSNMTSTGTTTMTQDNRYFVFQPDLQAATSVKVLDNLTALRAVSRLENNTIAVLAGLNTSGDGEGGVWYWSATRSDADAPPQVVRPNDFSTAGLWVKSQ